jgi:Flp pilus assembly protein TadD
MKPTSGWIASFLFASLSFAGTAMAEPATPGQQRAAAERIGAAIERAFNERDHEALAELIDFHAVVVRAAELQELSETDRKGFTRAMESSGFQTLTGAYFRALDAAQGKAKFMRVTEGSSPRSLVRLDLRDKGFNYLEFMLRTNAEGVTRAVDWFQLNTGELISVTLAGTMQAFGGKPNAGLLDRLFGSSKVDPATLARLQRANELNRAGKYAESLAQINQLAEPYASARIVLMARATAAAMGGLTDEYDRALTKIAELYSNDPVTSFVLLDYYFLRKNTPQVLKALDSMEKRVGVDGVTSLMRTNAYLLSSDLPNALKQAEDAIRLEPDRLESHDARATILVQLARYQEAVDAYRGMETDFGLKFTRDIFLQDPNFEPLVASKPFRAWLPK